MMLQLIDTTPSSGSATMHRIKNEEADYLLYCRDIMDSVADGVFTVDRNMMITTYNRAAEEMTGFSRQEAIGKPCHEVFRTEVCTGGCPLREAFEQEHPVVNREVYIQDKHGSRTPVSVNASVLYDAAGDIVGGVETIRNLKNFSIILDSV